MPFLIRLGRSISSILVFKWSFSLNLVAEPCFQKKRLLCESRVPDRSLLTEVFQAKRKSRPCNLVLSLLARWTTGSLSAAARRPKLVYDLLAASKAVCCVPHPKLLELFANNLPIKVEGEARQFKRVESSENIATIEFDQLSKLPPLFKPADFSRKSCKVLHFPVEAHVDFSSLANYFRPLFRGAGSY